MFWNLNAHIQYSKSCSQFLLHIPLLVMDPLKYRTPLALEKKQRIYLCNYNHFRLLRYHNNNSKLFSHPAEPAIIKHILQLQALGAINLLHSQKEIEVANLCSKVTNRTAKLGKNMLHQHTLKLRLIGFSLFQFITQCTNSKKSTIFLSIWLIFYSCIIISVLHKKQIYKNRNT